MIKFGLNLRVFLASLKVKALHYNLMVLYSKTNISSVLWNHIHSQFKQIVHLRKVMYLIDYTRSDFVPLSSWNSI